MSRSEGAKHQTWVQHRKLGEEKRENKWLGGPCLRLPFSTNLLDMADVAIPNGHYTNGNADYDMAPVEAVRFTSGLILPPPEIKCKFFIYAFQSNY